MIPQPAPIRLTLKYLARLRPPNVPLEADCNLFPEFDCIFAPSLAPNETAQVVPNGLADLPLESKNSNEYVCFFNLEKISMSLRV